MSRLMLVIAVAPLLAPTIGSLLADRWGWRSVFVVLGALAVTLVAIVARFLPETLRRGADMAAHGDVAAVFAALYAAGVDGVFSDFPGLAAQARA